MFGRLGMEELLVIGAIFALIFGPSQLPKIGRGIGESIKEFRKAGKALTEEIEKTNKDA